MSQVPTKPARAAKQREPAWEVAYLFPVQGDWTPEDYLALKTNWLVELSDGCIEVLPMPTTSHQLLVLHLYGLLLAFNAARSLGTLLVASLRVRLGAKRFREPDVVFMLKEHADRIGEDYWEGADLVMEVVSGSKEDRDRDLITKRREYARAGIPEYWIVDPKQEQITVLRLDGKKYAVHGVFATGSVAASALLNGFTVDVTAALESQLRPAAGKAKPKSKGQRRRQGR